MMAAAPCPRCKEVETPMHVLFHCPYAKEVWRLVPLFTPVHIVGDSDIKSALAIFRNALCLPPTGIRVPVHPWICWLLWTARNKLIFEDKTIRPIEVVSKALSSALEWDQSQSTNSSRRIGTVANRSNNPRAPMAPSIPICFVDAAWNASSIRAGIAWSIDTASPNQPLSGARVIDGVNSPLVVDALALCNGIRKAIDLGLPSIIVSSDCAMFIRAILTISQIKEIYGVFRDIDSLSSHFVSINFQFIPRSQNREADVLAKQALKAQVSSSILLLG
ncbi:hypothetical protein Bca52824_084500 [Brassica carinata]|uniref:RNase H type-1 domain-containing protein n=1 Tax=Brassica carinata TaxID=52824 RepID=A0A8X7PRJ5_BRACI|nr:hypothetical protein Bca52824_084500 [Brassica carinata]